jgi:hypothetical protein
MVTLLLPTLTMAFYFPSTSIWSQHHDASLWRHGLQFEPFGWHPPPLRSLPLSSFQLFSNQRPSHHHHYHHHDNHQPFLDQRRSQPPQQKSVASSSLSLLSWMDQSSRVSEQHHNDACHIMVAPSSLPYLPNYRVSIIDNGKGNGHILGIKELMPPLSSLSWSWPMVSSLSPSHADRLFSKDYHLPKDHICTQQLNDATYYIDRNNGVLTITLPKVVPSTMVSNARHASSSDTTRTTTTGATVSSPTLDSTSSSSIPAPTVAASLHDGHSDGRQNENIDIDDIEVSNERHMEDAPEKGVDASRGYMDMTGTFRPY